MNPWYRQIIKEAGFYQQRHAAYFTGRKLPCTAIIDTGIHPHPLLKGEIIGFHDLLHQKASPYDDHGHGTHIAGIIGGHGIFPSAPLFGVKTLDEKGNGKVADFIRGIEFLVTSAKKYHIRIINISLGAPYEATLEHQDLLSCVEHAWDCGLLVIAAAGNNGPEKGSITVPGVSRKIITVGTYDDNIAIPTPFSNRRKKHYSGRGPTSECIVKPDTCLPGSNIQSLNIPLGYTIKSGTSMSTPMLCALCAVVLSVHPDITPKEIKQAVLSSSRESDKKFSCQDFLQTFS